MRLLLIDPGATFSTFDVFTGAVAGLRALGHTVIEYRFSRRIDVMARALEETWKMRYDLGAREPKPNAADAALWTSELAVTWALRHSPVDMVIVVSGMFWHPDAFVLLKRAGFKTGLLFTESPYAMRDESRVAGLVDMVWTNERTSVS
jgi:hypothetical protein